MRMTTKEMLRISEIPSTYNLSNAKLFASRVINLLTPGELDNAIREASDEQMEKGLDGRIQVFIPCNTDSFSPRAFQEMLVEPEKYPLRNDLEPSERQAYGRKNDAFNGFALKAQRPHKAFLVYDSAVALIVDLIGREGNSLMNRGVRTEYLSSLERVLGYSVEWRESQLAEA